MGGVGLAANPLHSPAAPPDPRACANTEKAWTEVPTPEDKDNNPDCWWQPGAQKAQDGEGAAEHTVWDRNAASRIQLAMAQPPPRVVARSDPASASPKKGPR